MTEPTIALVFSPEPWVERLHRHLSDHGGARVRQLVLDPALALEDAYDVLVVSHRWPGLTAAFVADVRCGGRAVLGVFDPDEPAGRSHLLALRVDAVIACDARVGDFVELLSGLMSSAVAADLEDRGARVSGADAERRVPLVSETTLAPVVITGLRGSGVSEVALALAFAAGRLRRTVLIDATEEMSSLAPRLGLGFEPCLRTAVDAVEHHLGELTQALVAVSPRVKVVPGFPSTVGASQVLPREVVAVIGAVAATGCTTVVELGSADGGIGRAVLRTAGALVFVLPASPVGVTRTLSWAAQARASIRDLPVHLVVNRAPRDRFRRAELAHELTRTFMPTALWWAPTDRRVDDAMWRAEPVTSGPFVDAVTRLASAVAQADVAAEQAASRRRRSSRRARRAA